MHGGELSTLEWAVLEILDGEGPKDENELFSDLREAVDSMSYRGFLEEDECQHYDLTEKGVAEARKTLREERKMPKDKLDRIAFAYPETDTDRPMIAVARDGSVIRELKGGCQGWGAVPFDAIEERFAIRSDTGGDLSSMRVAFLLGIPHIPYLAVDPGEECSPVWTSREPAAHREARERRRDARCAARETRVGEKPGKRAKPARRPRVDPFPADLQSTVRVALHEVLERVPPVMLGFVPRAGDRYVLANGDAYVWKDGDWQRSATRPPAIVGDIFLGADGLILDCTEEGKWTPRKVDVRPGPWRDARVEDDDGEAD